ncbi:MAG: S9 family peptidase [Actinomycetia bacterium]|nr:S9 family peptidase [Actinomycetes bacterium]
MAEHTAPYGTWPSPLSAEVLTAGGVRADGPIQHGYGLWWLELRPEEGGRSVLVAGGDGREARDALAAPWSVRSLVHEYGGGAWWAGEQAMYLVAFDDQRLYRLTEPGAEPVALTAESPHPRSWRYADGAEHPDGGWVVCVRERHPDPEGDDHEPVNELVAIASAPGSPLVEPRALGVGHDQVPTADFVAAPRFSVDGRWMSWIRWNHPRMPWDGTELCVAPVFGGMRLGNVQVIAGNDNEAIHGANWTRDGRLVFSTDRSGFWNLHAWTPGSDRDHPLTDLDRSEIGGPQWVFGVQQWAELSDGRLVVVVTTDAADSLGVLPGDGTVTPIDTPFINIAHIATTDRDTILLNAATATAAAAMVELDPGGHTVAVHRVADDIGVGAEWFSTARAFTCAVTNTASGSPDREAHAFIYPPAAPNYQAPPGERPPLVVMGHGGPTDHASPGLNLRIQYWTSRGFAVADVNYGGSSGFGRAYRRLLDDAWGIVDVEDCIAVASELAADGIVDPARLAIRGGSAGGYTVLSALTQSEVFTAGTSLFGVADLEALARDTHKFESRYLDGLIGPYPERRDIYIDRSPINHADALSCPLLVLQGLEDPIVPPNQSEAIVAAVAAKGLPHAYVTFEGEQHGFRQAVNLIRSYELELWFYSRVFGFTPADHIEAPDSAVGL